MKDYTAETGFGKDTECWSVLEQIAREGARKMLQLALENEIQEYIDKQISLTDENGKKIVVRNGYLPERNILTGIGQLNLKQLRIRNKKRKTSEY